MHKMFKVMKKYDWEFNILKNNMYKNVFAIKKYM